MSKEKRRLSYANKVGSTEVKLYSGGGIALTREGGYNFNGSADVKKEWKLAKERMTDVLKERAKAEDALEEVDRSLHAATTMLQHWELRYRALLEQEKNGG